LPSPLGVTARGINHEGTERTEIRQGEAVPNRLICARRGAEGPNGESRTYSATGRANIFRLSRQVTQPWYKTHPTIMRLCIHQERHERMPVVWISDDASRCRASYCAGVSNGRGEDLIDKFRHGCPRPETGVSPPAIAAQDTLE
jgi:hypothetical protein